MDILQYPTECIFAFKSNFFKFEVLAHKQKSDNF